MTLFGGPGWLSALAVRLAPLLLFKKIKVVRPFKMGEEKIYRKMDEAVAL